MRARSKTATVSAFCALALAACATKEKPIDENRFPADYKSEIVDLLARYLADPTNVHDAYVSEPQVTKIGATQRYTSCVRYNARDPDKHYMGSTDQLVYFFAGHVNQMVDATPEQCGKAAYKPFPELQNLCRGESCK